MKFHFASCYLVAVPLLAQQNAPVAAFQTPPQSNNVSPSNSMLRSSAVPSSELQIQKAKLLELIGSKAVNDPVLVDPFTKEPIEISSSGVLLGGEKPSSADVRYSVRSATNQFAGSSGTYIDLLEVKPDDDDNDSSQRSSASAFAKQLLPLVPVGLRQRLAKLASSSSSAGGDSSDDDFVPMRDLFTSPAVSFAYERGWRQNFAAAGFPGPDAEAKMAMEYFAPVIAKVPPSSSVVVDMSCATGLFTRRFAESGKYGRVLGCDYSDSMLTEARRRIKAEPKLQNCGTRLDLVRLDVGRIPMKDESLDCLHAGAAMHCWPELDLAASEIYRVLKPGGRYFATTFLQEYFRILQGADGGGEGASNPSKQAFQYFTSTDTLRDLMIRGGFAPEKVFVEVLGRACVVIRC
eukprot:CAMPEP_0119555402 /NCGR_PEP_ID=MMETSP1352-20130426/7631_1 /TAXON_ID=265584 /ORGANISM="Stauroneis constricta, Strain CCMP1120" /LENGTH=405 /DNA_ID=CAMNT_0007602159 /DNA_START=261 /DNA_END=1475 /DNA_ORIENTATION=-